jgi:hypothetical protein
MASENIERKLIKLVAVDRLYIPLSSMDNKIKNRIRPDAADEVVEGMTEETLYVGERVYARIEEDNKEKARSMKEAVAEFCNEYPREGQVLQGKIAEKRIQKEKHLYFGVNSGSRLTAEDYLGVMQDLGFTEIQARNFYPELMDVSRRISKKRDEAERSVLVGKVKADEE